jgi:cell fate regulator YaaT (PSP1 superfamily)
MKTIIGIKFRKNGRVYFFEPAGIPFEKGEHAIVETIRGIEYGTVVMAPKEMEEDKIIAPLKPVMRKANEKDAETVEENIKKENEAFRICREKIKHHELPMKLIDSEYTFDRNKLLFYFTADGRIDFRELVKDLASVFRTRIELRQIGVRDETKLIGGLSVCGRELCCNSYLADFAPVSIKMAKEQGLSLNPAKISGVCGRLMCCLKNEQDAYEYLNSRLPHIGMRVTTADGLRGEVQSVNVLKQLVKVLIFNESGGKEEREVVEYPVDDLRFHNKEKKKGAPVAVPLPDETVDVSEIKELEELEKKDIEEITEAEEAADDILGAPKKQLTRQVRGGHRDFSNHRNPQRRNQEARPSVPYSDRQEKRSDNRSQRSENSASRTANRDSNTENRNQNNYRKKNTSHGNTQNTYSSNRYEHHRHTTEENTKKELYHEDHHETRLDEKKAGVKHTTPHHHNTEHYENNGRRTSKRNSPNH